jgi:hypothetical protein
MQESETHCARIEDVKVDDFIRFCEYAYRGDYTVPPWEEVPTESISTLSKNQQNGVIDDWGTTSTKKKKGKKVKPAPEFVFEPPAALEPEFSPVERDLPQEPEPGFEARPISRAPLRNLFNSRNYLNDSAPKSLILQHFEPKPNSAVGQNFTPVLLAHARLYCFAHLRLITPLIALTLDKLHKTLMNFKLYKERVGDIIELARYAYSNLDLPERSDDGTMNDLRTLVVEYIVCEIDTIGKCDEFVQYMEEGGEFVGDFWRMTRAYVV